MLDWPRAVLFDFDGVIVNSEPYHFGSFRDALQAENITLGEDEYFRELIGLDDQNAIRHVFARREIALAPETIRRVMKAKTQGMMDLVRRHPPVALPGVERFVRSVCRRYPVAICSGAVRVEIEAMLKGVRLGECFDTIVAAEDVSRGKPHPDGYLLTMRLLSERLDLRAPLAPGDCLIVEDAPPVIASVKQEGFPTLAVTTSYPPARLADADWICSSLRTEEVMRLIPQLKLDT